MMKGRIFGDNINVMLAAAFNFKDDQQIEIIFYAQYKNTNYPFDKSMVLPNGNQLILKTNF